MIKNCELLNFLVSENNFKRNKIGNYSMISEVLHTIKFNKHGFQDMINWSENDYVFDNYIEFERLCIIATILDYKLSYSDIMYRNKWFNSNKFTLDKAWFISDNINNKLVLFLCCEDPIFTKHNVYFTKNDLEVI